MGVLSSGQPATVTSWSSSRPDATPTLRLHQPGATGDRASTSSSRAPASSAPAPSSTAALVPPRWGATAASPFPIGMRNAASYASSSCTNFAEHEDLPGHHLLSIRSLITSSPDDFYPRRRARSPTTSTSSWTTSRPRRPRTTPGFATPALSARSSSRRLIASPALRTPVRGVQSHSGVLHGRSCGRAKRQCPV